MSGQSVTTFSRESTTAVLQAACARVGLDPEGAELIRLGENAIYRLRSVPAVVRIARSMDRWADAAKEVAVSQWLARSEVSAARTWDVEQPVEVDGHPVTFWHYIEGRRGNLGDVKALGEVLYRIHGLAPPTEFVLPPENVLGRVESRVERASVPPSDRSFLLALLGELAEAISHLDFPLEKCVTHGDAHVQNLMFVGSAATVIDFERACWGQPEWDLSMTAAEFVTARFWTPEQYGDFTASYGFNIMEWSGFETLRRTQEVKMTTWLMQNINESAAIYDEYLNRMQRIRSGRAGNPWRAF